MSELVVRRPGEGDELVAGPTVSIVKVGRDATGGRLSVVEMRIGAGWSGPPPHVHDRIDHLWWVLAGDVALTVADEVVIASAGACLFVPAGTPHGFSTADSDGVVVLQIDSPQALDGYFRDLADAFPDTAPPDPAVVGEIMRRHDTRPVP